MRLESLPALAKHTEMCMSMMRWQDTANRAWVTLGTRVQGQLQRIGTPWRILTTGSKQADGVSLEQLIGPAELDIEFLNLQLERYGRSLYLSGLTATMQRLSMEFQGKDPGSGACCNRHGIWHMLSRFDKNHRVIT